LRSNSAISVCNVSKSFRVHMGKNNTLKDRLLYAGRARYRDFVALKDVSVEIPRGATVGLVGANGSGKSTLLKLISRILYPDSGTIEVRGVVSSLLELGAGFHQDFSGRENVYLNASILGFTKREIDRKLDEIVDFSELGDFIDEPIRGYSSGMTMRLAFSVATVLDPEILLIDEILAVGDAPFQAKCVDRLKRLQSDNRTIVIVTHDTSAVERMCDHAIWLHNSRVMAEGDPSDCVQRYVAQAFQSTRDGDSVMSFDREKRDELGPSSLGEEPASQAEPHQSRRVGSHDVVLERVALVSSLGSGLAAPGEALTVTFDVRCDRSVTGVVYCLYIRTGDDILVYGTDTKLDMTGAQNVRAGDAIRVTLEIPSLSIAPGMYTIDARIVTEYGEPLDVWPACAALTVVAEQREVGCVSMPHGWRFEPSHAHS